MIILALPTAEHEYTYRYVIPAVPLVCMAAALAFRRQGGDDQPATGARPQRNPDRKPGPDSGPGDPDPRPAAAPAPNPNPPEAGRGAPCPPPAGAPSSARRYPFRGGPA